LRTPAFAILAIVAATACHRSHVRGSTLPPERECTNRYVVVNNTTNRIYDIYVSGRLVGTADPNRLTQLTIDPGITGTTATLREAYATRNQRGLRLSPGATRVVCE
jgi:hypothetical protein